MNAASQTIDSLYEKLTTSPAYLLGLFILANGLASMLSAPIWGLFADSSSRKVMITAALLTAAVGIVVFFIEHLAPGLIISIWFLPAACFVCVAHGGVRVGRKTYVVDLAGGNRRTDYVAVSNTVIGIILLITGFAGALSDVLSISGIIFMLSLFGLGGAILGVGLIEVE